MANTFTQLYIQLIFAVKFRQNLISKTHKDGVEKYITGIIQNRKHKLLAIYCRPDHIHILIGLHPQDSISNLVTAIKKASQLFIREHYRMPFKFEWQRGYGAFSYTKKEVPQVINYILNQDSHHQKKCFRTEYIGMLVDFGIQFEENYLFDFYGD